METFSALLAICAGNSLVPCEFPAQRPVTRSFDAFFDLRLIKQLSKQSWDWWFKTLSCPLWRHSNVNLFYCNHIINSCFSLAMVTVALNVCSNVCSIYPPFDSGSSANSCVYVYARICYWINPFWVQPYRLSVDLLLPVSASRSNKTTTNILAPFTNMV